MRCSLVCLVLSVSFWTLLSAAAEEAGLPKHALYRLGDSRFQGSGQRLAFSPDGKVLAIAANHQVRLLQASTGATTRTLVHRFPSSRPDAVFGPKVIEMRFLAKGTSLLTGDEDGGLHVWSLADGKEVYYPQLHPGLSTFGVDADEKHVFTGGFDGSIQQWELATGTKRNSWTTPGKEGVFALAVHEGKVVGVTRDGLLLTWDPKSGEETRRVELGSILTGYPFDPAAAKKPFRSGTARFPTWSAQPRNVEFSPDGQWLFQLQGLRVWNVATGEFAFDFESFEAPVHAAFSADASHLVVAPNVFKNPLRVFSVKEQKEVARLDAGLTKAVALSPDGQTVAYGAVKTTHLWKHAANELTGAEASGTIKDWDFSPKGDLLAVATETKVRLYAADTGQFKEEFPLKYMPRLLRFHPDGETLIVMDLTQVGHYQKRQGTWQLTAQHRSTDPLIPAHDVDLLVPVRASGQAALLDLKTGGGRGIGPHKYTSFTFSPDGRSLLMTVEMRTHPNDPSLAFLVKQEEQLFSLPDVRLLRTIEMPRTMSYGFSPDGRLIARGNQPLRLYEAATGKERLAISLPSFIAHLAFAPDGRSLILNLRMEHARDLVVVDLTGKETFRAAQAHEKPIAQLRVSRQGKVVTLGGEQTLLVWSAEVWKQPAPRPLKLEPEDLGLFYRVLLEEGGENVSQAIDSMIAGGDGTVAFLKLKLQPAREAAAAKRQPAKLTPAQLQLLRSLEVLEKIGSTTARETITNLTRGHPEHFLTIEARISLERLQQVR